MIKLHLMFDGTCADAFAFYAQTLGGKVGYMLRYGDSPAEAPPHMRDKIVHGNLTIGDLELTGADVIAEQYEKPQGFYVLLDVADQPTAKRYFDALATGGSVKMPLQKTFWAPAFGVLVDRFGIPWEINCS